MKVVAVILVRMNSSRLPGKVMRPVLGTPLLGHLLDRVERCTVLDEIVVATTTGSDNDLIQSYCDQRSISVFRGSESDVLGRLLQALEWRNAQIGVLIFGDCPLIDPEIITEIVSISKRYDKYDFVSNDLSTSWPPGMEVEVFKVSALADSACRCEDPVLREHGTLYMRQNPDIYHLYNVYAPPHLCRQDLSLEVDVVEDLEVIEAILTAFNGYDDVKLEDIIHYLNEHPTIAARNSHIERRWKQFRND